MELRAEEISWPTIGHDYIVRFDGVWQHSTYRFDCGDNGDGTGEYFWDNQDCDEGRIFDPENDGWITAHEAIRAVMLVGCGAA